MTRTKKEEKLSLSSSPVRWIENWRIVFPNQSSSTLAVSLHMDLACPVANVHDRKTHHWHSILPAPHLNEQALFFTRYSWIVGRSRFGLRLDYIHRNIEQVGPMSLQWYGSVQNLPIILLNNKCCGRKMGRWVWNFLTPRTIWSSLLTFLPKRNGSAFDSRSKGYLFKSGVAQSVK